MIFKPGFAMQSLFRFKDKIPEKLKSYAVYHYKYRCYNATYIGKLKRQIRVVRQFEHLGPSVRTNRPLSKPPFSAIRQHSESTDHPIYLMIPGLFLSVILLLE